MTRTLAIDPTRQEHQLQALFQQIENDIDAPLYDERVENGYRPVLGEGKPGAGIIFIGEAPSAREAVFGRPFIGAAGQLFHDLIKMMHIDRSSVYLTNLVKDCTPDGRNPTHAEIAYYSRYLEQEIDILQPLLIMPMGNLTTDHVLQHFKIARAGVRINEVHGQVLDGHAVYDRVKIVPLLHPSAALYDARCLRTLYVDLQVIYNVAKELWLLD